MPQEWEGERKRGRESERWREVERQGGEERREGERVEREWGERVRKLCAPNYDSPDLTVTRA